MISLSVIIPIARPCAPFVPVTGTAPQSHSTIICATSRRLVSGVHMAGLSVMMSRIVISYPPLIFTTTKSGAALFCDRSDYRRGHRRGFDEPAFPNPNVTAGWFLVFGFWYLVIRLAAQRVWACRSVLPLMHCSTLPPTVQRSMPIAHGPNAHRSRPSAHRSPPLRLLCHLRHEPEISVQPLENLGMPARHDVRPSAAIFDRHRKQLGAVCGAVTPEHRLPRADPPHLSANEIVATAWLFRLADLGLFERE